MESRSAPRLHQDFHSAIKASRFLTAVYIGVGAGGQSFTGEAIRSAFAATSEETMPISKKLTRLSYARWTPRRTPTSLVQRRSDGRAFFLSRSAFMALCIS